jgi:hypothetical protein
MKKFFQILACLASSVAVPAHAALTVDLSRTIGTFGNSSVYCTSALPCAFTDSITFTTASPFNLISASIFTVALGGIGSTSDINFTRITLDGVEFSMSSMLGGIFEVGIVNQISFVPPGTHTLVVSGITYGSDQGLDGNYSGTLVFASNNTPQTAVPEPAVWVALMAGFAMIGHAMRNRGYRSSRVRFT